MDDAASQRVICVDAAAVLRLRGESGVRQPSLSPSLAPLPCAAAGVAASSTRRTLAEQLVTFELLIETTPLFLYA